MDSEWRAVVDANGKACVSGDYNEWDSSICSTPEQCSQICYLNAADYPGNGVSTSGNSVKLLLKTPGGGIGSRVYLFDEDAGTYVNFKPLNKELAFDVDMSTVGCALNAALYFSEMDVDGGTKRFPNNKAGAKYGTGYCDAQCPKDGKFVGNNANIGRKWGSCCYEFDIWEGNLGATQMALHPCSVDTPAYVCDDSCNHCDTDGCTFNPFGDAKDKEYYGPGLKVDPTKKMTVVTQFTTDDGTDSGSLKEIRRLYVQGGKVIQNAVLHFDTWVDGKQTVVDFDSLSQSYCDGPSPDHAYSNNGGSAGYTKSFQRGQVLVLSFWTDGQMNWLDAGDKGLCDYGKGREQTIADNPDAYVEFSNIRFGDLDTTY